MTEKVVIDNNILVDIGNAIREMKNLPSEDIIGYGPPIYKPITKFAGTSNINLQTGQASGTYSDNLNTNTIVTIPGAATLHVELWYSTEATRDYVCMWEGAHSDYTAPRNVDSSITGKLHGGASSSFSNATKVEYDVQNESVTFGFYSDSSVTYYGYYAKITGEGETDNPIYGPVNQIYPDQMAGLISSSGFFDMMDETKYGIWGYYGVNQTLTSLVIPIDFEKVVFMGAGLGLANSSADFSTLSNCGVGFYTPRFYTKKLQGSTRTYYESFGTSYGSSGSSSYFGISTSRGMTGRNVSPTYRFWLGIQKNGHLSYTLTSFFSSLANPTVSDLSGGYIPKYEAVLVIYEK